MATEPNNSVSAVPPRSTVAVILVWTKLILPLLVLVGVAIFLVGVMRNSNSYKAVVIELMPGKEEPTEVRGIAFFGGNEAPDYSVDLQVNGRWCKLGSYENRSLTDGPLRFEASQGIPKHQVQAIRVRDRDIIESDTLDESPIAGSQFDGGVFRYTLEEQFDFQAGLHWFFTTSLGQVIAWSVGAAIFVFVLLLLITHFGVLI